MRPLPLVLPLAVLLSLTGAAARGGGTRSAAAFKALDEAFPGQVRVSEDAVTKVEFCPDNTCYAFEASRGVPGEQLAGFVYLYLFYSSEYVYTEAWQNNPDNAALAGRLSAQLGPVSCCPVSGAEAGLCVLNSFMGAGRIKVFDVRYDENERAATPVKKALLGRTGEALACRDFTEIFLKWYVPLALQDSKEPAAILALRRKPAFFSEKLRSSLEEDRKAQERTKDIVGIDFDPFLSSQDPADKYTVGKVTVADGKCLVDIKAAGAAEGYWDVRAEAKRAGGAWRFTNFHYNTDVTPKDLLSILRDLKLARSSR